MNESKKAWMRRTYREIRRSCPSIDRQVAKCMTVRAVEADIKRTQSERRLRVGTTRRQMRMEAR